MKSSILLLMIATAGMIFQCCQPANRAEEIADTTTAKDHTLVDTPTVPDSAVSGARMFIEKAALGGMLEIALGKLAKEKARDLKVKEFGKLMEQEHTQISNWLKALASAKAVKLPAALPENDLQQIQKMSKMADDRFENVYMKMMVADHKKDIADFKAAVNSNDTAIAGFARKVLPVLESHLEKALKIRAHLKTEAEKSLLPLLP